LPLRIVVASLVQGETGGQQMIVAESEGLMLE
jgi:hypothetical protein